MPIYAPSLFLWSVFTILKTHKVPPRHCEKHVHGVFLIHCIIYLAHGQKIVYTMVAGD